MARGWEKGLLEVCALCAAPDALQKAHCVAQARSRTELLKPLAAAPI